MTIAAFLLHASKQFAAAGIDTARLDAQVLLQHALDKNKAWLLAHSDEEIAPVILAALRLHVARRAAREPIAYIVGHQEFYGRDFTVTPAVLIPRPETETLIDEAKLLPLAPGAHVLDVGTGSGAIAVTAALDLPRAHVTACDSSPDALAIAKRNAERLGARVEFFVSDLLAKAPRQLYDCIIANLPYVANDWQRSPETAHEPALALFAAGNGLALITALLAQAPAHLAPQGYLLLEADPRQFAAIKNAAEPAFRIIHTRHFAVVLQKR